MLNKIWSEESFKQLFEEPLQAGNRDGIRLLAKVKFDEPRTFYLLVTNW